MVTSASFLQWQRGQEADLQHPLLSGRSAVRAGLRHRASGLRERLHALGPHVRRGPRRRHQPDAGAAQPGRPGDHSGHRWLRLQAAPMVGGPVALVYILAKSMPAQRCLSNLALFKYEWVGSARPDGVFSTLPQLPRQVPQNCQGPGPPLWDHLHPVGGGQRSRCGSHLGRSLQDGGLHAATVTWLLRTLATARSRRGTNAAGVWTEKISHQ